MGHGIGHRTHFNVAENLVSLKIILHGKQPTDAVTYKALFTANELNETELK